MSDSDEKHVPSNSSDISIEEIGPEGEAGVNQHAEADEPAPEVKHVEPVEIPQDLDDVSVGGRIEEIPTGAAAAAVSEQVKHFFHFYQGCCCCCCSCLNIG